MQGIVTLLLIGKLGCVYLVWGLCVSLRFVVWL